eukprot:TRINITY_DN20549_c0_g1::TRINITY_DN20549_c0_g1_i1::g.12358::m.12358 TRINITY_DN20549_c0_g1::TRINITY_DN20549_c0_g1_i1::g.12358  ORF type:complete len:109 (+),score=0.03 TRINITY_DN20549_c0_g1_i1:99-425(+)
MLFLSSLTRPFSLCTRLSSLQRVAKILQSFILIVSEHTDENVFICQFCIEKLSSLCPRITGSLSQAQLARMLSLITVVEKFQRSSPAPMPSLWCHLALDSKKYFPFSP